MVRWCHSNHQSFRWIILRRNHMSPRPLLPCFNLGASSGTQVPYPWSKKKGTIYSNSKSLNHSFLSSKPPLVFKECVCININIFRDNTNLKTRKNTYKHRLSIPKNHHPLLATALADTAGADAKGPICVSKASSSTKPEGVARAKTTRGEVQQTWRFLDLWLFDACRKWSKT